MRLNLRLATLLLVFGVAINFNTFAEDTIDTDAVKVMDLSIEEENETSSEVGLGEGRELGIFRLTAYCSCNECQGGWGELTATGTTVTKGRTIAVDKNVIPLGTLVDINIPGEGWHRYKAEDVGGGVKGNHIDIYIGSVHSNTFAPQYNCQAEVRLVN